MGGGDRERLTVRGQRLLSARLWPGRVVRRLSGEAGQDVVEYAGVLLVVAAIVAAVASLSLSGVITRAVSCELKQITNGDCTLGGAGVSEGSARGAASPSTPGGGGLDESQVERALGSNRLISACAGNGQTELGSDRAADSPACKQELSKLSPKAISTLELLAAVFQAEHDYKPASGPPCTAAQATALAPPCAQTKQQFFQSLLSDDTRRPGDAVIALSRQAQQLQSGPILRNEKIESTHGDRLDGFLGSLCGGYGICLGGTVLSQAYQQAYHASARISKITTPVLLATGIGGALKDLGGAGLKAALARLGGGESEEMEQTVAELESQAETGTAGGSPPSLDQTTLAKLPEYKGGKTNGILDTGTDQIQLESGYKGPSSELPQTGNRGMNWRIRSHVEAHVAALMRIDKIENATLYINREPCPGATGCAAMLSRMLPPGAKLRVVGPGGYDKVFTGEP